MKLILTDFPLDANLLTHLHPCIDDSGMAADAGVSDEVEWPNNILSRQTTVYESGVIARAGEHIVHNVAAQEWALCKRLAAEATAVMGETEVGMGSEDGASFRPFFVAANVDAIVPNALDAELVRNLFRGTIFPSATITVEPLQESGVWWSEVLTDAEEMDDDEQAEYLQPWREMMQWFQNQPEFIATAFVRIGDSDALQALDSATDSWPEGTQLVPCTLPRLFLGLTRQGSVVGLFGFVVQT